MMAALFLETANRVSMRRLAAAAIHGELADRFPRCDVRTLLRVGGGLSVVILVPRWWGLAFGIAHLVVWWRARRLVRRAVEQHGVKLRWQIRISS